MREVKEEEEVPSRSQFEVGFDRGMCVKCRRTGFYCLVCQRWLYHLAPHQCTRSVVNAWLTEYAVKNGTIRELPVRVPQNGGSCPNGERHWFADFTFRAKIPNMSREARFREYS